MRYNIMAIEQVFSAIIEVVPEVFAIATAVVTGASVITAGTRTPAPTTFWGKVYKVIEFLALVWSKAKEEAPKK
jgi:hypothetical protein